MKFIANSGVEISSGSIFLEDENSLTTYGECGNCSLLIENTCLTLDFDITSKKIIGISGYLGNIGRVPNRNVIIPEYEIASLFTDSKLVFQTGIAYKLMMGTNLFYDNKKRILLLEAKTRKAGMEQCFMIAENIYICLSEKHIIKIYIDL